MFRRAGQGPDVWITVIFFSFFAYFMIFSHVQITSSNLSSTIHCLMVAVVRLQPFWDMSKQCRKDIDSHLYWKNACFHQAWFYFTLFPLRWNKLTARKEIDWNLHIKCSFLLENLREWAARMFFSLTTAERWQRGLAVIKDLNSVVW